MGQWNNIHLNTSHFTKNVPPVLSDSTDTLTTHPGSGPACKCGFVSSMAGLLSWLSRAPPLSPPMRTTGPIPMKPHGP